MITRIQAKNFFSWKELDFSVENGVTLIDGFNEDDQTSEGSGKTAVLNALSWGVYGKIPKELNLDDVISHGKSSCEVSITFDYGKLVIVRTRKPNDLYWVVDLDDEPLRRKDIASTQKEIAQLVGLSFEAFSQTIYQAQNNQSRFIRSNQEDKMKILTEIIELGVFDRAKERSRELHKEAVLGVEELNHSVQLIQMEISLNAKDIEREDQLRTQALQAHKDQTVVLEKQLEVAETTMTKAEESLDLLSKQHEEQEQSVKKELSVLKESVQELLKEESSMKKQIEELDLQILSKDKIKTLRTKYAELKASEIRWEQDKSHYENTCREIKRLDIKYSKIIKEKAVISLFIKDPTKICPTCSTLLTKCDTSSAEQTFKSLCKESEELEKSLGDLNKVVGPSDSNQLKADIKELGGILSNLDVQQDALNVLCNRFNKLRGKIVSKMDEIPKKDQVLIDLKNFSTKSEEIKLEGYTRVCFSAQDDLRLHKSIKTAFDTSNLEKYAHKKNMLEKNLKGIVERINEQSYVATSFSLLGKAFKQVKLYVFEEVLTELNVRVNAYLESLFTVSISLEFKSENKKIETDIVLGGNSMKLGLLSGGQFRRVALAIDLALNDISEARNNSLFDLLILDEYMKDLSESSMEKCLLLLRERNQPVLLIEHNSIFKSIVQQTFFVHLKDGISSFSGGA